MDPRKKLPDNRLIHEGYSENPYPFWFWLFFLVLILCLAWGFQSWYQNAIKEKIKNDPFLQVTNRELSLFLWQNPELMRANVSKKSGYLPGFQYLRKVTLEPEFADSYATAPPEVLFLYHTWNRQIRNEFPQRPIHPQEFAEFLSDASEWQPQNWPGAPKLYADFVSLVNQSTVSDLQLLSQEDLPNSVRMAFQGWKNYYKEGELINKTHPTYGEMKAFLENYPHYARNYWRNIMSPLYLQSLTNSAKSDEVIPDSELAPFLRAAFYNAQKARESKNPS